MLSKVNTLFVEISSNFLLYLINLQNKKPHIAVLLFYFS